MLINTNNEIMEKGMVDKTALILYLLFVFVGWFNIYAASFDLENATDMFDLSTKAGTQLIWIGTSLLLAFALLKIEVRFYETYAFLFYIIGIVLLVITAIFAKEINGSRSWLQLGPFSLQPAEFMKFILSLTLAKVFYAYDFKLMEKKNLLMVISLILLPVIIVIFQSETGTALVYLSLILVLYREGLPGGVLFMGVAAVAYFVLGIRYSEIQLGMLSLGEILSITLIIIFSSGLVWSYLKRNKVSYYILLIATLIGVAAFVASQFKVQVNWGLVAIVALSTTSLYLIFLFLRYRAISYLYVLLFILGSVAFVESTEYVFSDVLQPHQQMRILVTLGIEQDLNGAGYHVGQSKIAIGSGGLTGKGYLNGTQTKLKYVPEQETDFIFCTIGEEHGFIGTSIVIILFSFFILHLLKLAERQTSVFGRVYGYCVVSIFFFHLMVNIGMVIGLMPVIGIPLPFYSYGGSSLWGFTILLFIFLRIDKTRKRN